MDLTAALQTLADLGPPRVAMTLGEHGVLGLVDGALALVEPKVQTVRRWLDGAGFVPDVEPGDIVSLHWDWACEVLSPSRLDALPRAVIEATVVGTPVIGTAVGGIPEILDEGPVFEGASCLSHPRKATVASRAATIAASSSALVPPTRSPKLSRSATCPRKERRLASQRSRAFPVRLTRACSRIRGVAPMRPASSAASSADSG